MRLGAPARKTIKSYVYWKPLKINGKSMVSSLQSWQRVTATQEGPKRTARNHTRNPLKTLEFLMFSDGPQPVNSVRLEIDLAPRAKSYVYWKTLKILGKSMVSSLRSWQRVTASIVFSRQGTHGISRVPKKPRLFFCWIQLVKPDRSPCYMPGEKQAARARQPGKSQASRARGL